MKSEVKEEIQTYIRYINENDLRDKCEEYIQMFFFLSQMMLEESLGADERVIQSMAQKMVGLLGQDLDIDFASPNDGMTEPAGGEAEIAGSDTVLNLFVRRLFLLGETNSSLSHKKKTTVSCNRTKDDETGTYQFRDGTWGCGPARRSGEGEETRNPGNVSGGSNLEIIRAV